MLFKKLYGGNEKRTRQAACWENKVIIPIHRKEMQTSNSRCPQEERTKEIGPWKRGRKAAKQETYFEEGLLARIKALAIEFSRFACSSIVSPEYISLAISENS